MGFDPVRDAVLNSPHFAHHPLPSPSPQTSPSPDSISFVKQLPLPRSSSLARLLNDDDNGEQPQSPLAQQQRHLQNYQASEQYHHSHHHHHHHMYHQQPQNPPSPTRPRSAHARHSLAFPPPFPNPTQSPLQRTLRSPTTPIQQHHPQQHNHMPPPPPPATPYNPIRKTQPTSVLRPLTQAERDLFANPTNILRKNSSKAPSQSWNAPARDVIPAVHHSSNAVRRGEKRLRENDNHDDESARAAKRAKDQALVAQHYNERPEVGLDARGDSPIIGLKHFNNWIKSVLIHKFSQSLSQSPSKGRGGRARQGGAGKVLDMGCGKGGDLQKWSRAHIREYVGLDVAAVSIEQAKGRWAQLARSFSATFAALDCYAEPISRGIPPAKLVEPFDMVSMQFCMHYAFETVSKTRMMLDNVSKYLRPGGIFIGTVPNSAQLLARLKAISPGSPPEFGNSVYTIRFEDRDKAPIFGHRYWFYLKDAVDAPEYIVRWDNFESMAREYDLELIYKREFHEVFEDEKDDPHYGGLLQKMKVVDEDGGSSMDEDQWEAANIYLAFAFKKK